MNKIELKVSNYVYKAWIKVNIYSTMNAISRIAELKSANYYPRDIAKWNLHVGDEFQLLIENQVVMTGYIDAIKPIYKNRIHNITLVLRDKTADLNDCNWNEDITEWKNQTVLSLTQNLCSPFDIQVATDSEVSGDISKTIETFKINEGEYIVDALMRFCNQFDLIPLSYGDGFLTLSKSTTTQKSYDAIDMRGNVIEREAIYSNIDRYSDYIVKGIGQATDRKNNYADYIQPTGSIEDSVVQRYRPIVYFDDVVTDSGKCMERAKWLKQVRAGQSRGIKYTIIGWLQTNEEIWKINHITRIIDPVINIDADMLIDSVRFIYEQDKGSRTEITVVDKRTYTKTLSNIKTEFDA